MNWLELVAALLGVLSVWMVVRRQIWAFPIGIVMVCLYAAIFYQAKFYADMALQGVYVVMQAQGWYLWARSPRDSDDRILVRRMNAGQWALTTALALFGTLTIGYYLKQHTDAALPYVDALTTSVSLLAQWWMNTKYLENWLLWIGVDLVYLFQYSYKALYLTTGLYAVFLVMAVIGYQVWRSKTAAVPLSPPATSGPARQKEAP
ncbi:MAG: nicotinamide riboside transporter PnuC [Saprospiraceae bacterium]